MYYAEMKEMNTISRKVYAANHIGCIDSFPEEIIILPTLKCNYSCITCTQDHSDASEYPDVFLKELEGILPFARFVNITGGEPLLYSKFFDLVDIISKYETRYWLVTNGSLLDKNKSARIADSSIQNIKFSIDGGTKDSYKLIRRIGDFNKVMQNVAEFMLQKIHRKRFDIGVQFNFVALQQNIDSLPRLVTIAGNMGVDQVNVIYCVCENEALARNSLFFDQQRSDEKMVIAAEIGKKLGVHVALPKLFSDLDAGCTSWMNTNTCDFPFKFVGIERDGRISICCGTGVRKGNMFTDGFKKAWNDPLWVKIRETVNTENEIDVCKNCTLCKQKPKNVYSHIPNKELADRLLDELVCS